MKRRFALTASVIVALVIVGVVMALTSVASLQAAGMREAGPNFAAPRAPADSTYQPLPFFQNWSITTAVSVNDDWSGAPGVIGYLGDFFPTSTAIVTAPQNILSDTTGIAIDVIANQANPNTQTSGGVAEFDGLADPVVALQGSGTADAPFIVVHLNTTGWTDIVVAYNLRDVDGSADNAVQSVALQYRVGSSGNFTNLPAGFVADASTGPSQATLVTPVTVTLPAAADNQAQVQIRIITGNAAGSDEWIGIDDISVTGTPVVVVPEADLDISKDGPTTALAGENITYTLSLSNTGTATATGSIITDTLPSEVTFVTYTTALPVNSFTQNGQDLIWDLGDVPTTTANATIGVEVFVSPLLPSGASFTNTVTASTTYTESDQTDNADSVTTFIGAPDLAIAKSGPASASAGDTFTYTLAYSNAGTIDATGVAIVDQLPTGVTFVTATNTSVNYANGQLTWNLGALNVGASGSIEVAVTADRAGDWVNTATISGGPVDADLLNNTASITTTIFGADPYVLKSGPTAVFIDRLALYTLTYGNRGNVTATATLTDQLPAGFTAADIATDTSGLPASDAGSTRAWTVDIAPNSAVSFTLALTVPTAVAPTSRITNTLTISAVESGDNPADNTALAASTAYEIVSIATARAGLVGEVFGVEGQVIYAPGAWGTNEWGVQDASGGISVFFSPAPTVQLNDQVRLVATRGAFSGQPQLGTPLLHFANLGAGPQVTPKPYTTGQVLSGASEGWLVVVTGTVSGLPACTPGTANYQFNLNDGSGATVVFVDKDTLVDVCAAGVVNGDRIVVTGFSTQFNGLMEIKPRFQADVKRLFDVTFVYNDLEDVVAVGEDVQVRGDFNGWAGTLMSHDAGYTVFSLTVTVPTTGTQNYKYYAAAFEGNNLAWDLLNTNNRSLGVNQGVTVKQDYRTATIGWGNLNGPASATINLGASVVVSGQVYVQSVTAQAGAGRGVKAEMGYGTDANPANWTWSPLTYASETGNNDVFAGALTPAAGGVYSYALRYDANFAAGNPNTGWTYADLNGVPFSLDQAGVLTVTAPQLALTKSVDKPASEMKPGDVVTYTIELSNSGDGAASGVLITDVLPVEVTFGGFVQQNGAAYASGTVTWGGPLNAGATATVVFTATVGSNRAFYGRTVTNTAQFTSDNGGSDSAEAVFQIVKRYFLFAPIVRR